MGRRPDQSPFTLFSFQDIITSVTGVMILVALLLSLMIGTRHDALPSTATAHDTITSEQLSELQDEIARLQSAADQRAPLQQLVVSGSLESLKQQLSTLQQDIDRLAKRRTNLHADLQQLSQSRSDVEALEAAIATMESELTSIDQQKSAQAKSLESLVSENRVEFHFRQVPTGIAWLVDVHGDHVVIAAANQDRPPVVFRDRRAMNNVEKFKQWCDVLPTQDRYFVFVIRPDGIGMYDLLRRIADTKKAEIGIELLGNDIEFIDQTHGAVLK